MNGLVSNIQRFSVHDGYGIRTIVFLVGCTLRCAWCQNPETIDFKNRLMFVESQCNGCLACLGVCEANAISFIDEKIQIDRVKCTACLKCLDVCYFDARQSSGKYMSADETFEEFMNDLVFYKNSGGGLTLSGGEPLCQVDFAVELLKRCKENGIHTAIETAGNAPYSSFLKVLPYTDLFLYDIKMFDCEKHENWTFSGNKLIFENLEKLSKSLDEGKEIIVVVPLIPRVNDGAEFRRIVDYLTTILNIKEIHIMAYHSIGSDKYNQLGEKYPMLGYTEENDEEVNACKLYATQKGFRVSVGGAGF